MRSSSWVHSLVVPAVLAVIEAAWLSAWIGAAARLAPGVPADTPFLSLAVPAIAVTSVAALSRRIGFPRWTRPALLALVALVLAALTAGTLAALYLHGALVTSGFEPWAAPAGLASAGTALAWFLASLLVARGAWLGWAEPSVRAVATSLVVSGVGFGLFLVVAAIDRRDARLHAAAAPAALLLVCCFPAAIAVAALVREREVERWGLGGAHNRPGLEWLAALMAPMAVVVVAAVVLALVVGPSAPLIGRALRAGAHDVAALFDWLARELSHAGTAKQRPLQASTGRPGLPPRAVVHVSIPGWARLAALAVAAVVGAAVVAVLLRALFPLWLRLRRISLPVPGSRADESDSLFSWSHLLAQLRAALAAFFSRFRRTRSGPPPAAGGWAERAAGPADVRAHYRSMLTAARAVGQGRAGSETPLELERRLAAGRAAPVAGSLRQLTELYDTVRYGEQPPGDAELVVAAGSASKVVEALRAPLADGGGQPGAAGGHAQPAAGGC